MFSFPLDKTQLFWQAQVGQSVHFGNTLHAWMYTSVFLHVTRFDYTISLQENLARKIWETLETASSLQHTASLTLFLAPFGAADHWENNQRKTTLTVDQVPSLPSQRCSKVAGSASVASLYLPTFIKQLNSWVHDQNTEPAPSLNLFLLFVFQRIILNLCQMHLVRD